MKISGPFGIKDVALISVTGVWIISIGVLAIIDNQWRADYSRQLDEAHVAILSLKEELREIRGTVNAGTDDADVSVGSDTGYVLSRTTLARVESRLQSIGKQATEMRNRLEGVRQSFESLVEDNPDSSLYGTLVEYHRVLIGFSETILADLDRIETILLSEN